VIDAHPGPSLRLVHEERLNVDGRRVEKIKFARPSFLSPFGCCRTFLYQFPFPNILEFVDKKTSPTRVAGLSHPKTPFFIAQRAGPWKTSAFNLTGDCGPPTRLHLHSGYISGFIMSSESVNILLYYISIDWSLFHKPFFSSSRATAGHCTVYLQQIQVLPTTAQSHENPNCRIYLSHPIFTWGQK
jgi:hypothetical protein